ncbi:hypothetical protein BBP40_005539 [Aspergillus hancockii]|nr:hypothetical protein BBP40_005539 [Aspergillus hancockii]
MDFADPIWINISGFSLKDIQVNAECDDLARARLRYAMGSEVPALNTRHGVFISISADFHGTLSEDGCILPSQLCTPAIKHQDYESDLVHALRADNGDPVYVPTTCVYFDVDEVFLLVTDPNASGALKDVKHVLVTNAQIQLVCPGKLAGGFYLHKTMLKDGP